MKDQGSNFWEVQSKKKEALIEAFNKIEEKHLSYFKNRPSKFSIDDHDRLKRHYIIYETANKITFAFDPETDLPENIKTECTEVYISLFGPGNDK